MKYLFLGALTLLVSFSNIDSCKANAAQSAQCQKQPSQSSCATLPFCHWESNKCVR